jgi:pantoate--beta-alanine ligase
VEVATAVRDLRLAVREARARAARSRAARPRAPVGLVPTMGALHEGHLSLIRRARAECAFVVVSLFVNPTQFAPSEDLARYPRDFEADRAAAEAAGAGLLFAPPVEEVYPEGFSTHVTVEGLTARLEGASRPAHFQGVTTVVAKLFNMAQPDRAYFGEKDYQQLQVVRRMTRDLDLSVEIVPCPTVREPDGLALSSRNRYLAPEERQAALSLFRGLAAARERFEAGERRAGVLVSAAWTLMDAEPLVRVDYAALADVEDLTPVRDEVRGPAVLLAAARVGETRLIDNVVLRP